MEGNYACSQPTALGTTIGGPGGGYDGYVWVSPAGPKPVTDCVDSNWVSGPGGYDLQQNSRPEPVRAGIQPGKDEVLPSIGSVGHWNKTCKACLFVHTKIGCQNGAICHFCHYVHKGKNTSRPCKSKRDRYRKLVERCTQAQKVEQRMPEGVDSQVLAYVLSDRRHAQCLSNKIQRADDADRALLAKQLGFPPGLEECKTPPTPDTILEAPESVATHISDEEECCKYQTMLPTFDEIEAAMLQALESEFVMSV